MRGHLLLVLVCTLLSAAGLYGQEWALPGHFGTWTGSPSFSHPALDTSPFRQAIARETGETAESRTYTSAAAKITVTSRKFQDPSRAYEAYTATISSAMAPSGVAAYAVMDKDRLVALLGNVILEVAPPQGISTADLKILTGIVRAGADRSPLPGVRAYLPEHDLRDGTQKYALGPAAFQNALTALRRPEFAPLANEAGFSSDAEAMLAEYQSGTESAVLLLLLYPTPHLAELHAHHLQSRLPAQLAATKIERKGSLLRIVLGPTSAAFADRLRNSVNYETQVTWNEPRQTATDPPLTTTTVKIIMGTAVLMVMAVVLGVAFGGVRVLTKTLLPGKVFDRPDSMDILQLGLSGKTIHSRDFY